MEVYFCLGGLMVQVLRIQSRPLRIHLTSKDNLKKTILLSSWHVVLATLPDNRETPDFGPYLQVSRLEFETVPGYSPKFAISSLDSTFRLSNFNYFALFELFLCYCYVPHKRLRYVIIKMWLVGRKPIRSFVTRQKHLFRAFCVIANSWGWESILRTTDVMCRALWRHLQSLPYQFSIFEYFGAWQPWMYTKPWKDKGVTHNKLTLLYLYINRWSEGFAIAVCVPFAFTLLPLSAYWLKVLSRGTIRNDDFSHNIALQC